MGVKNTVHHTHLTYRQHHLFNAVIYACSAIAAAFGIAMVLSATGVI